MEITLRGLWTLIHGIGFGVLYLMACAGALVELYRRYSPHDAEPVAECDAKFLRNYLAAMAVLAWITVLTGTYFIYPWYRAIPPALSSKLADYPQRLLMASPATSAWHSIGMEWKEHVAWIVPIAITMAASVCRQYGRNLSQHPELLKAIRGFVWASLIAAVIAGFFGAMINKNAPVNGGSTIHIAGGEQR